MTASSDRKGLENMRARNARGLLRWTLVAAAAAIVFVGCGDTTAPTTDPGETTSTSTEDVIVFGRNRVSTGIWRMYSNGTGQRQLTTPPGENGADTDPVLSPDGSSVVFARNHDIWLMNADGTGLRNVSSAYSKLGDKSDERDFAWSPEVEEPRLYFTREVEGRKADIYALNVADPGDETASDVEALTETPATIDLMGDVSPDGEQIAFSSNRKDRAGKKNKDDSDIFRMPSERPIASSDIKRLTSGSNNDRFPKWSPDDGDDATPERLTFEQIVFNASDIVTIEAATGANEQFIARGEGPAWSPDGTNLLYVSGKIWKVGIDPATGARVGAAGDAIALTATNELHYTPDWGLKKSIIRPQSASLVEGETLPGAGSSYLEFKVVLSSPSTTTITVPYSIFEDDATEVDDYDDTADPLEGTLTFAPEETQKAVKVAVVDDDVDEPEEAVELELGEPEGNAIVGLDYAIGLIKDNDAPPVVEFDDVDVDEGAEVATFDIDLIGSSGWPITISYDHLVEGTTATAGSDYTRVTNSVTFQPGQTHKEFTVPILDDGADESDETFKMKLVRAIAARSTFEADGSPGIATGTILDNDGGVVTPPGDQEIAFARWLPAGGADIWRVPVDGGDESGWQHPGFDFDPDWGHGSDSDKLYFSSYGGEPDEDIYVRNVDAGTVTKVQDLPGEQYAPTISPDGNLLAFYSDGDVVSGQNTDGDFEIFVKNLSTGSIAQMTNNAVNDTRPEWNPASNVLVYTSGDGERDLWKVSYPSGTPAVLKTTPGIDEEAPAWAPDGGAIAFNSDHHGSYDIYLLRVSTLVVEQVTFYDGMELAPTFSPDGQSIAYGKDLEDIAILDIADCIEDLATSDPDDDDMSPDWKNPGGVVPNSVPATGCVDDGGGGGDDTPIEGDITYVSRADEFASGDLHSMDPDGQNDVNFTNSAMDEGEVSWNGDGTKVAFVRNDNLFVRDAATGVEEEIVSHVEGSFLSPSWHPTENVVAFANFGDPFHSENDYDIYAYDLDAGTMGLVTDDDGSVDDLDPAWSPDGSELAFSSDRVDVRFELFTVPMAQIDPDAGGPAPLVWVPDGPEQQRTTLDIDALEPSWSPEGDLIAFNGMETEDFDDLEEEIYFLDTTDDSVYKVTDSDAVDEISDIEPVFSPDGEALLYSSDADGDPEIYALDLNDCTTTTQLTTNAVWDTTPAWRPDATAVPTGVALCGTEVGGESLDPVDAEIVYSKNEGGEWDLWIMNDDGTQQTRLTDFAGGETDPVWSPDGTLVAFLGDDGADKHVFVLDPSAPIDGSNPVQVSSDEVWGDVTWTPDGKVAWVGVDPVDSDFDIYTADADGSNSGVLVNTDLDETDPQVYDDGGTTRVLFITSNIEGADDDNVGGGDFDSEVWAMDIDGSNVEQITHTSFALKEHLSVSTDGLTIAYSSDDGDIYTDDVDTTTLDEPVAETTDGDTEVDNQPSWSSDSSYLVYVNFGGSSGDIYKMPWGDETSREQLTSDPAQEFSPDWKG